jgi:PKD repeat protein
VRLDKYTGRLVWSNNTLIAITPNAALAAHESKVYRITGGITIPIVLTAIDVQSGKTLYSSAPIPGDGDQENPITLGPGGRIYFWRDGGKLYAYEDQGSGFQEVWSYTPQVLTGAALSGNITLAADGDLYVFDTDRVLKIDSGTGDPVSATESLSFSQPSISVGADSTVYINDGKGQFYAYSADLQTKKWQLAAGGNVYCNPALAKDGILVLTQAGTRISAYQFKGETAPVADFRISKLRIAARESVDFFDQSSFSPTEWYWEFPGARNPVSNERNPQGIIYDNEGVFDVVLKVSNAMGRDSIVKYCKIEVVPATANRDPAVEVNVQLFPNPVEDLLNMELTENLLGLNYAILDLFGRPVRQGIIRQQRMQISLTEIKSGWYCLQVGRGSAIQTIPFVKL